jgi:hypothetical protein
MSDHPFVVPENGTDITPEHSVVPVYSIPPDEEDVAARAAESVALEEARIAQEASLASARAKLARLGLTPEEVDSIIGPVSGVTAI